MGGEWDEAVKRIGRELYHLFALPSDPSKEPSDPKDKKDFLMLIQNNDE